MSVIVLCFNIIYSYIVIYFLTDDSLDFTLITPFIFIFLIDFNKYFFYFECQILTDSNNNGSSTLPLIYTYFSFLTDIYFLTDTSFLFGFSYLCSFFTLFPPTFLIERASHPDSHFFWNSWRSSFLEGYYLTASQVSLHITFADVFFFYFVFATLLLLLLLECLFFFLLLIILIIIF